MMYKYEKLLNIYTVAPCSANQNHVSCKKYILIFGQWLFKLFTPPQYLLK